MRVPCTGWESVPRGARATLRPVPSSVYVVTCLRNTPIARDTYECAFTKPEGFAFRPGQFVLFSVPLVSDPADVQPRAYSIASAPQARELLFVVRTFPVGRMSRFVTEVLRPGTEMSLQGPFGVFTLDRARGRDLLLVCTGTGVAPFHAQLSSMSPPERDRRIDLVHCVRHAEEFFWQDRFAQLEREYPSLRIRRTLSEPSAGWNGCCGRVQSVIPWVIPDVASRAVFLCGNPQMTKEVKQLCLNAWGVPKGDVHVEGYI